MVCPAPVRRFRLRPLVEGLAGLLIAWLVMRTWYVQGLVVPCRVVSGSMAAGLVGPHRDVVCGDCGCRFVCAADDPGPAARAVCPNCGFAANDLEALPELAGDGLLIQRSVFGFRRPRRWEVVAFYRPQQGDRIHVKRVVGLPGESIQIRHGDVYVDGRIARKTLPQQHSLAVLVHDARHRPTIEPGLPPRWRGCKEASRWVWAQGRFTCPGGADRDSVDWLEYCHWRRIAGKDGQVRECQITDFCGYNQTRPRREEDTNVVTDLMLSFRLVKAAGRGRLLIRATDGWEEFQVEIDPAAGSYEVLQGGRPLPAAEAAAKLPPLEGQPRVEVSLFDQQFLLALDGRPLVVCPYDRPAGPNVTPIRVAGEVAGGVTQRATCRPLAIGSRGGLEVVIEEVCVYRDVYYTHPIGLQGRWGLERPVRLGADEYFVLGDNSPVSEDSRSWPEGPAVFAKLLVGKPLLVCHPAKAVQIGGRRFQVPDLGRIRYIR